MKIAGYDENGVTMVGSVDGHDMVRKLGEVGAFWRAPQNVQPATEPVGKLSSLRQRPAVPTTARIICIGLNYRRHAEETGQGVPKYPLVFGRWFTTLAVDGQPVPAVEEKFDWEAELAVVIGRRLFAVTEKEAVNGIYGYAAFNDLSARTYQVLTSQFTLGKNSDASGPMSPIVTADEVGDPAEGLRITTVVNGEIMQDASTDDLIFSIPHIISHLSHVMTLEPGDVIATGTPAGVGLASGKFLEAGDVVEVEIERIGKVRTPIIGMPPSIA